MQDTVLQLRVPTKGLAIYLVMFFAVPMLHSEVQGAALSVLPHVVDSDTLYMYVLNIKYMPSPTAARGTSSRHSSPCAALGLWVVHWDTLARKVNVTTRTCNFI